MNAVEAVKITTMKVRDFIKINRDIDVYDDVCEELGIAFCGPMMLAEAGKEHFADVLDYDIEIDITGDIWNASVKIDGTGWKRKLRRAEEFFHAAAGYCSSDDYDRWFIEPDFGQYHSDPTGMMEITIYRDTAPWYTEDEMNRDNLTEMSFPRRMVQEFYTSKGNSILTFVDWIENEYTADDTDGLFGYCKDRGFIAVRED